MRVCNRHFSKDDFSNYLEQKFAKTKLRLKKNAVPKVVELKGVIFISCMNSLICNNIIVIVNITSIFLVDCGGTNISNEESRNSEHQMAMETGDEVAGNSHEQGTSSELLIPIESICEVLVEEGMISESVIPVDGALEVVSNSHEEITNLEHLPADFLDHKRPSTYESLHNDKNIKGWEYFSFYLLLLWFSCMYIFKIFEFENCEIVVYL